MKPIVTSPPGLLIIMGMLLAVLIQKPASAVDVRASMTDSETRVQDEAFALLDAKCNSCHRRKNPFMVFSKKNMAKRSDRIYLQVFVSRRMPKGDDIQLTENELTTLEQWLQTQNINTSWN